MKGRVLAALILAAAIGAVVGAAAPTERSGTAFFMKPTLVAGHYILGQVLFVHDETKMARGEPCTTIYGLENGKRGDELVSFHCKRLARPVIDEMRVMAVDSADLKTLVMKEYQLPGEAEGHGVPAR
jgi:hypothetical protein